MNKLFVVCVFLSILSFQASAKTHVKWPSNLLTAPQDSTGIITENGKTYILYKVETGETLYGLSRKYGVRINEINEANKGLADGLKLGEIIRIPYNKTDDETETQTAAAKPQTPKSHVVQPGETLYGISKKYGISVEELKQWNNWELKAGQELRLWPPTKEEAAQTETEEEKQQKIARQAAYAPKPNKATNRQRPKPDAEPSRSKSAPGQPPVKLDDETGKTLEQKNDKTQPSKAAIEESNFGAAKEVPADQTLDAYPDDGTRRILIIPFDPYLYFSDADDEIAENSDIPRPKIRQFFRRRLNALIDPPGYESIHLLGGTAKDSLRDLDRIYKSINYIRADIQEGQVPIDIGFDEPTPTTTDKKVMSWVEKQKKKLEDAQNSDRAIRDKDKGKYYGVTVKDPSFFTYFNDKYHVNYYIFVNQFEVKTNYENCLDRARQDYERNFIAHFTIFNDKGEQITGNRVKIFYNSNSNSIYQIVGDNMQQVADAIMAQIPKS